MSRIEACVEFLQQLIRIESMPGEEGALAMRVSEEMKRLAYDDVSIDEAGNVIGVVRGTGGAPPMMYNTHLDHVDAGDPADWPQPPFGGVVRDGVVWGRGAVDIKGPLAAQVYGVGGIVAGGERPPGDVWVTAVVQEEIGGLGARFLCAADTPDLIIIGEPSRNELRRGHRGRVELQVRVRGRMAHASMTGIGRNPLTVIGRFLTALESAPQPDDPDLGRATIAPTLIRTDQTSANVIPGELFLTLDCRTVPGQSAGTLRGDLLPLLENSAIEGSSVDLFAAEWKQRSYTGYEMTFAADNPAYALAADDPAIRSAANVLGDALGAEPAIDVWQFATDGGHFAVAGRTVVGFGPGDDRLAHTVSEKIEIDALEVGMRGNEALARSWPAQLAARR